MDRSACDERPVDRRKTKPNRTKLDVFAAVAHNPVVGSRKRKSLSEILEGSLLILMGL